MCISKHFKSALRFPPPLSLEINQAVTPPPREPALPSSLRSSEKGSALSIAMVPVIPDGHLDAVAAFALSSNAEKDGIGRVRIRPVLRAPQE